jgi:hypothetical protein
MEKPDRIGYVWLLMDTNTRKKWDKDGQMG